MRLEIEAVWERRRALAFWGEVGGLVGFVIVLVLEEELERVWVWEIPEAGCFCLD